MYSDWSSLTVHLQLLSSSTSVLSKFPADDSRNVVISVVRNVASSLGILGSEAKPSLLKTDKEISWIMEVISHGLSLPLSEHETIKDCVNIYCEWLSALLPNPKTCVPESIIDEPNRYSRKIISHLYHLFVPRRGEEDKVLHISEKSGKARQAVWAFIYQDLAQETIHRQAVLCHRVLRRVQDVVQQSETMERETWEALLGFLLAINDALLAPPTVKDDVGDQLCERVLGALYEIWLISCVKCFPSPPLWKTFREMSMNWRHRTGLVDQWNRVNLALTSRLLSFMYGPTFPKMKIAEDDAALIPESMTEDCISQTWYRFLHSIGNPVDLAHPSLVSQTQHFYQYAIVAESVIDPTHHPCLATLPSIFLRAMKGISAIVDAYLGLPKASQFITLNRSVSTSSSVSPSSSMANTNSNNIPSAVSSLTISTLNTSLGTITERLTLAGQRPKCNSILHLFGKWLFDAAFIGTEFCNSGKCSSGSGNNGPRVPPPNNNTDQGSQNVLSINPPYKKPSSVDFGRKHSANSPNGAPNALSGAVSGSNIDSLELPAALTPERFESGRAEAIGALCRIFCAKKTDEEILPIYLARFYLAVQQGLIVGQDKIISEVLAMILVNSCDLLRLDLEGVNVLVPYLISALEHVLTERELRLRPSSIHKNDLRRSGIHLLISMLSLPHHFQNLSIKELLPQSTLTPKDFVGLRPRMINLLISSLQAETDTVNTQMLLGGLLLSVQDAAILEEQTIEEYSNDPLNDKEPPFKLHVQAATSISVNNISSSSHGNPDLSDGQADEFNSNDDSSHTIFVRATYLVCHRLISSWKSDLSTSLAALELLAGLARIKIPDQARKLRNALECKRAVKWICDYIVTQCSRPPPAHSKDLHSSIVAAFHCCKVWLLHHPYLLQDKECIATVLEVVELGISGTKSKNKASDTPICKEEKSLSPASRRVKDSAESLLNCILEQTEYFPSPCGAESISSLMNEVSCLQHLNNLPNSTASSLTMEEAIKHYRYFVVDNSVIVAILEESFNDMEERIPSVTLLLRCSSGRFAWSSQLRHLPRHKSGLNKSSYDNPGRPLPLGEMGIKTEHSPKFFPESIDRIPLCKADKSIPAVESVAGDERAAQELDLLSHLMDQQAALENDIINKQQGINSGQFQLDTECIAPDNKNDFQTARLILSHLGLLSLNALQDNQDSLVPRLISLNAESQEFMCDLEGLDHLSSRTWDTAHIFYVARGQKTVDEILSNVESSESVHPHFLEFLASLGWPVNVWRHTGWTGHISTAWRCQSEPTKPPKIPNHGGGIFNGDHHVLYWADALQEVSFVVPTLGNRRSLKQNLQCSSETSSSKSMILELDNTNTSSASTPTNENQSKKRSSSSSKDHDLLRIMVVWLESFEDCVHVPIEDLISEVTSTDDSSSKAPTLEAGIIFIQPLNNGLLRIKLQGQATRITLATPLIDGVVVSRRCLGSLVRQTALNMSSRKRLDQDNYLPPHVKRKLKIQEIVNKHRNKLSRPEFYSRLLSHPSSAQRKIH
ncbi:ral GTPase-activating protein subunit beta isoform X23 [Lepeophtheirus salmonis]|uniref:ral GTPase-activating protein subunit beta isoform X23 n=1 Tax=Lepeophtheirus salmonis TaxID=72036 RepID=UPI001AE192A4|nr:ral GTPase-activating protein subunit beta-like isoform X9 [Lepeophtheirus salmonis]